MIYFKNSNNAVFAYQKEDVDKTERLTELEICIKEKEPELIKARMKLQEKQERLDDLISQFHILIGEGEASEGEYNKLQQSIITATEERDLSIVEFNEINSEYNPLKEEFDTVPPVFFSIRENLKSIKKMSSKEIDAHLNPPKTKEQHALEAEQKKQLCTEESEKNITILERKVRLGMATEDEKDLLTAWEIYSIKIADIDTSTAPDIEWPQKP
ncbi:tail fiber assembly protein [Providencia alcalifaciens]|uniref:tail fiber assembly protein n=1 Tax=Providencia alcalifaciens TaxID=126385 RepID=UPI003D95607E